MFELTILKKYLLPSKRNLTASIIGILSIVVISLVVWLALVFLSVTSGMEKNWTQKLIALSAPIQVIPTPEYYQSFYYQVDSISRLSNYTPKNLAEKLHSPISNPYDPTHDPDATFLMAYPDLNEDGHLKDLVKEAYQAIQSANKVAPITVTDYEITACQSRFRLLRSDNPHLLGSKANIQNFLTQISYIASYKPENIRLKPLLLEVTPRDITNLLAMLSLTSETVKEDHPGEDLRVSKETFQKLMHRITASLDFTSLQTPEHGSIIDLSLLPKNFEVEVGAFLFDSLPQQILFPKTKQSLKQFSRAGLQIITLKNIDGKLFYYDKKELKPLPTYCSLSLEPNISLNASLMTTSIDSAKEADDLQFYVDDQLYMLPIKGLVSFQNFEIGSFEMKSTLDNPLWIDHDTGLTQLPSIPEYGQGVLLPKSYRDNGVLIGDRGYLAYQASTATSLQEQRIAVFVAGFFDPGLIPTGSKLILTNPEITSLIASEVNLQDPNLGNGLGVFFESYKLADSIKSVIESELKKRGIDQYWNIRTFKEFEFAKDFIEQIDSDKNLFTLVAILIILVACTNIISMLLLLVNDKKKEIGILSAMGASPKSLILIFGLGGSIIGVFSSLCGTIFAYFTLKRIDLLVAFLSYIQGHQAFNPSYFGDILPKSLSFEAFTFVCLTTTLLSLLAGIVPALKVIRMHPTEILRSE